MFLYYCTKSITLQDWQTVDHSRYKFSTNMGPKYDINYNIKRGNYNMMMEGCPIFDVEKESQESSMKLFRTCFPAGFAWELLEILSGK